MNHFLSTTLCSAAFSFASFAEEKPIRLFNGKDLTGWTIACVEADKGKGYCFVKDGYIGLDAQGNKDHAAIWVVTEKQFSDFELTLKVKTLRKTKANSGINFRSHYLPHATEQMWLQGPQIDVNPFRPYRTGLVYDATYENRRWIFPDKESWVMQPKDAPHEVVWHPEKWNTLRIKAVGMHIQTWLNGKQVTDYDATGTLDTEFHKKHKVGVKGHIALQLHQKQDVAIAYKDIFLKPINKK